LKQTDKREYNYRAKTLATIWIDLLAPEELPQLDKFLADYFKKHKSLGSKDRAFYRDMLFDGMRYAEVVLFLMQAGETEHARLDKLAAESWFSENNPNLQNFLAELRNPAEILKQVKSAEPAVFFAWIEAIRSGLFDSVRKHASPQVQALLVGLPNALVPYFLRRAKTSNWSSEESEKFLRDQVRRALLWLRVHKPDTLANVKNSLTEAGFSILEEKNLSLAVRGETGIYNLPVYKEGLVEVQDYSSVEIGRSVDAHPGMAVWDACAGAGGKTVQLAASLENRGVLYASDIREWKLDDVKARTKKAGYHNVRRFMWDGENPPEMTREIANKKGFHRVLVDAPCSSSGTWRRNPDARYRITPEALQSLLQLQSKLLISAAPSVRPGGLLVYATCSWFVEENEDMVDMFLQSPAGKSFSLESMNLFGSPKDNSDTMFSAVFKRG